MEQPLLVTRWRLGLLCFAATLLLTLPSLLEPGLGGALSLLSPVPVSVAFLLGGPSTAVAVSGAAAALMMLLAGPGAARFLLLETALSGLLVGFALRRRLPYPQLVVMASGTVLGGGLAMSLLPGAAPGLASSIQTELDRAMDGMREMAGSEAGALDLELYRRVAELLFPGLLAAGAMAGTLLCALLAARLVRSRLPLPQAFASWRLPEQLIWPVIAAGFAAALDARAAWGLPANVLVVAAFLYTVQGLAVAAHLLAAKVGPTVRLLITLVVVLQPFLLAVFLAVGLLDFRFDFRRPKPDAA